MVDADSVKFNWIYNNETLKWHHVGIFYKVLSYENNILTDVNIDDKNDDSFGAEYYDINELKKEDLSEIAILELEKLGFKLN